MSSTVDSRVVQMQFDNRQFEQNISQTIGDIEKLNKSLEKSNKTKGLSALADSIKINDFDRVAAAVDDISKRFSTLGIVGMNIINRLTDAGINMGKRIASSMTGDFFGGGKQRAINMEQSKFLLEGTLGDAEKVNDVLKDVDSALTGTAYGLDEGAKAAAVFAAAGIKQGEDMENAIKSVAGAAAMSGANFMELSDIFSDMAAQGKVSKMELDRFAQRGLAVSTEWAKELGISEEEFAQQVKDGKLEVEDFLAFMSKKYGDHAQDANKTFTGSLANMKTALKRWGAMFYEPGIQFARDIFNSLQTSIKTTANATKFAVNSFKLWGRSLTDNVTGSIEKLETEFHFFTNLGTGLSYLFVTLLHYLTAIGEAFSAAFPRVNLENIGKLISKFVDFSRSIYVASSSLESFKTSLTNYLSSFEYLGRIIYDIGAGFISTIKEMSRLGAFDALLDGIFTGFNAIPGVVHAGKDAFSQVFSSKEIAASLTKIIEGFNSFMRVIWDVTNHYQAFVDIFVGAFSIIKSGLNILSGIGKVFGSIFSALTGGGSVFEKIASSFATLGKAIANGTASITIFDSIASGIANAATKIKTAMDQILGGESIFKRLSDAIRGSGNVIFTVFDVIADAIGRFVNKMGEVVGSFDTIRNAISAIGFVNLILDAVDAFHTFTDKAGLVEKVLEKVKETATSFKDNFLSVPESIKGTFDAITESLTNVQEKLSGRALLQIAAAILAMAIALKMLSDLDVKSLATGLGGISAVFGEMIGGVAILLKVLEGKDAKQMGKNMKALETVSGSMIKLGLAMLIMAKAIKMISELKPKELAVGLTGLTVMLGATLGFVVGISRWSGKAGKAGMEAAESMIIISAALIIMAKAVQMLSSLSVVDLGKGLGSIVVLMGVIFGFVVGLDKLNTSKYETQFTSIAISMIGLAAALMILSKAVDSFGNMNNETLIKGLGSVIVLMGAIFGLSTGLEKLGGGGKGMIAAGIGMIAIASAIRILTPAIKDLGDLNIEQLSTSLTALCVALLAMAAASQYTDLSGAGGILAMAVGLSILATAIENIGTLDIATIAKGLGTLLIVLGAFVAIGAITTTFSELAVGLLAFGAAVAVVGVGIIALGAGLTLLGAGLTSLSAGILSTTAVTSTAIQAFTDIVKAGFEALISLIPTVSVELAEGFVAFVEQIAALAPRLVEAGTTLIHSFLDAVNNNVPDIIATGLRIVIKFMEGIEEATPRIVDSAIGIVTGFIDGVASNMDAIVQSGINLMLAFINGLADGVRNNSEAVREAILNLCTAILESFCSFFGIHSPSTVMQSQGTYLVEGLANGISAGNIAGAIRKLVTKGLNAIKGVVGKFKAKGMEIAKNIISGIKSKASGIGTAVKAGIEKAKSKIKGAAGKFKTAGGDLVKGIANGIRNGASRVISAAGSIASRALSAFKRKLGISSPSKVFAEEAKWIPEGIVVGIKKTSGKVAKAMGGVADNTVYSMRDAISRASDALMISDDFNPTITPVLDLTDVRKNAGQIGSILGGQSLSMAYSANQSAAMINQSSQMSIMNKLLDKLDDISSSNNSNVNIVNNMAVEGASNPEEFTNQFIRSLRREMRVV